VYAIIAAERCRAAATATAAQSSNICCCLSSSAASTKQELLVAELWILQQWTAAGRRYGARGGGRE